MVGKESLKLPTADASLFSDSRRVLSFCPRDGQNRYVLWVVLYGKYLFKDCQRGSMRGQTLGLDVEGEIGWLVGGLYRLSSIHNIRVGHKKLVNTVLELGQPSDVANSQLGFCLPTNKIHALVNSGLSMAFIYRSMAM